MKKRILKAVFLSTALADLAIVSPLAAAAEGSRFSEVWQTTQESPYSALPQAQVSVGTFMEGSLNLLLNASQRTLDNHDDILPYFKKLLHPNAICYAGTWNITEATPYSGYFKQDSKGLIIFRASAALSEINRGEKRSFGLAGKIYPTEDPNHKELLKTANFFVIDNLAGTKTPNYLDTKLTNDITSIDFGLSNISQLGILAQAAKAFGAAEDVLGKVSTVRQLYEISELGEASGAKILTPKYIKIQGQAGPRTALKDFRDDLRLENNGGSLRFDIFVSPDGKDGKEKVWTKIGFIEATDDSLSEGCDHRLHFHHPVWRTDLTAK